MRPPQPQKGWKNWWKCGGKRRLWWFQRFFFESFTLPTWENDSIWLIFFKSGGFNHRKLMKIGLPDCKCAEFLEAHLTTSNQRPQPAEFDGWYKETPMFSNVATHAGSEFPANNSSNSWNIFSQKSFDLREFLFFFWNFQRAKLEHLIWKKTSTRWFSSWPNLIPDHWRSPNNPCKKVTCSPSQKGHQQNCQAENTSNPLFRFRFRHKNSPGAVIFLCNWFGKLWIVGGLLSTGQNSVVWFDH